LKAMIKQKIILTTTKRIAKEIAPQNPLIYLKEHDVEKYINELISTVYLFTRPKKGSSDPLYMVEIISAIGHRVRGKLGLRKDSALAAKTGAFLLYTFEVLNIIHVILGAGRRGHNAYIVDVLDDATINELWKELGDREIEKLPALQPHQDWKHSRHPTGMLMVKTGCKETLESLTPQTHPIVFNVLNRAQQVGWRINTEIHHLQQWALKYKTVAFADIWEQQNPEARATKLREARSIDSIASKYLGTTFYHLYYYDFRGRKYAATAYLHEQGSDVAKGLLLRDDKKRIGKEGFFWLLVSIASNWGGESGREDGLKTDKIPLEERYQWALANEDILLSYAKSPKVNQGWMKADKPWQFIAACFELRSCYRWAKYDHTKHDHLKEEIYEYESHLECFIDGSNNGSQHLCALTRDEVTAPHVNLVPLDYPGDLYKYVADHVWDSLEAQVNLLTEAEVEICEKFIDDLVVHKKRINSAPRGSEIKRLLVDKIRKFKEEHGLLMVLVAPVFWFRIQDAKEKRKIVKRNTMTLPYGGTPYGLGQQIIDDAKKHGIEQLLYMEHSWGAFLGREVFKNCQEALKRPMQLLDIFEKAGKLAEAEERFLKWTVPITNFPVVQHYTEGRVKKIWVQYGPPKGTRNSTGYFTNTLQLHICFVEDPQPSKRKQAQGASPNAIHSLDAAHLMLTVDEAPFPITTVHDSFGCLLADMPELYKLIRETFVELHEVNPLYSLFEQIGGDISDVDLGNLDINLILDSEYCFS